MTIQQNQLHLHTDYRELYDRLEQMRELEGSNGDPTLYHKLVDSLPKLLSSENLIDYHNFLMTGEYQLDEVEELEEETEKLSEKRERILMKFKGYREYVKERIEEERDQLRKDLLNQLRTKCSPEAYSVLEEAIDSL